MPEAPSVATDAWAEAETPLPGGEPANLLASVAQAFQARGDLARQFSGYRERVQQRAMAESVAQTLLSGATLVAEAGTGTGKTYAYLVPALLHGGKVMVSTGTKPLQDQLFLRDLPAVIRALRLPVRLALLKGRQNYLCHWHLERIQGDDRALHSREEVRQLRQVSAFARRTLSGDRAELAEVPETAAIWQKVTSTRDTCLGTECPHYRDCFVVKARKQAQEAEVVVVNHALFLADLALKEDGISDLLPAVDCVIFDEAHQLPEIATRFLGESLSTLQLLDLARDALRVGQQHSPEAADWPALTQDVEQAARRLRGQAGAVESLPGQRCTQDALPDREAWSVVLEDLATAVTRLRQTLAALRDRHPDLELLTRRPAELLARLQLWRQPLLAPDTSAVPLPEMEDPPLAEPEPDASGNPGSPSDASHQPQTPARERAEWVRWLEVHGNHVRLQSAPLSVAHLFSRSRHKGQAWVLTSATLSVREDFKHFTRQLGLVDARTERWESPFDYPSRALLYVPDSLPEPNQPTFLPKFVEHLLPLLEASQGHALILCTTLRAVDEVHQRLAQAFAERDWAWPLLKQGSRSRRELLDALRREAHTVLVGSASFWEGIDVPGDALTLVAIDKLPFAPPDDPVIEARIRDCRRRGGNPFVEFQLPHAAIALKQGAGRLIRAESDWGVLMVGDRRLVDKPYGKTLWRGLPPFARTRQQAEAVGFLNARGEAQRSVPDSGTAN